MNDFVEAAYAQAQQWLPTKTMILAGLTISVTANDETHYKKGSLGGYAPEDEQTVSCVTSDLPANKAELTNQQCTIDGEPWRVGKVKIGASITHLTLMSIDEN